VSSDGLPRLIAMTGAAPWASVVFTSADGTRCRIDLVGAQVPTLEHVEWLARLQLDARRAGGTLQLVEPSADLHSLLDLLGLIREVGGQAEVFEELVGLEEGVDPADPAA
jgi:hypothetical protein